MEVAAEHGSHIRPLQRSRQVGGIAQVGRPQRLPVGRDRRMVQDHHRAGRGGVAQEVLQPGELIRAEVAVSLARHETVEGDDPVAAGLAHGGARAIRATRERPARLSRVIEMPAAQNCREGIAVVVIAYAVGLRDAPGPGKLPDLAECGRVALPRAVIGHITADDDQVEAVDLGAVPQQSREDGPGIEPLSIHAFLARQMTVRQMQYAHGLRPP